MRRTTRTLLVLAALLPAALALPAAPAAAHSACASASTHPAQMGKRQARLATLCLLNRQRRAHGLGPLRLNRRLTVAAVRHSRNMVRKDFFAHGNFVARIVNAHYVRHRATWSLAENIAWGTGHLATPREIVRGWMNSSGHRANILNKRFREIGIGVSRGAPVGGQQRAATYATDFGTRY